MNAIPYPVLHNVADLIDHFAVPPQRIRLEPRPGSATEDHALQCKMCELIDGVLVEKAMGFYGSPSSQLISCFSPSESIQHAQAKIAEVRHAEGPPQDAP